MLQSKVTLFLAVASCIAAASPGLAESRPRPQKPKSFESNKGFGLGLMLGVPTGLSGKLYLSKDTALDFAIGSYYRYSDALDVHMDFLWHPFVLTQNETMWIPFYFGVGVRAIDTNRDDRGQDIDLGVRVPVGLAIDLNNTPLDFFLEAAFVFDIVNERGRRSDFNMAVGMRYYFY